MTKLFTVGLCSLDIYGRDRVFLGGGALSTAISWSYYGSQAWAYIFGDKKSTVLIYQLIYCGFIIIGSALNIMSIVDFSDAMVFAMALPNILGLYILAPTVKKELESYLSRLKSGEIKKTKV